MIDPGTAFLAGKGLDALGGLVSGDKNKKDRAEQAREFNLAQQYREEQGRTQTQFDQVSNIGDLQRRIEQAPARDKALFMLNQRLGMTPDAFRPRDMMNPGISPQTPDLGGIDPRMQQQAMQGYHAPDFNGGGAGSGGVDPRVYHQLMARLGMGGPYGQQTIGDVPIQKTTYAVPGQRPPQQPPAPQLASPQMDMQRRTRRF